MTYVAVLDAGSSFTVTGPKGSLTLPLNSGSLSAFNMTGAFLVPGAYTITGTGGASIGPFSAAITMPALPTLVTPLNGATATRSNELTITWTRVSEYVEFELGSRSTNTNWATAVCVAPAGAGTFTIPPYILQALPAGSCGGLVLSSVAQVSFTATGINVGLLSTYSNSAGFGYGWGSGNFTLK